MKIAALIATLLIGSSSLALAQPITEYGHGPVVVTQQPENCNPPAPVVQVQAPVYKTSIYRRPWVQLMQPERMVAGQVIHVGAAKGQLNRLELKAVAGTSFVKEISIGFAGGGSQLVKLNQALDRNNPTISIDLAGTNRVIKHIEVYGSGNARSAYQMLAV